MILLAVLIQCAGFYAWYNTSLRAELSTDVFSRWLQNHRSTSLTIGYLFVTASLVLFCIALSVVTGLLTGAVLLMTIGSLLVILFPLRSA